MSCQGRGPQRNATSATASTASTSTGWSCDTRPSRTSALSSPCWRRGGLAAAGGGLAGSDGDPRRSSRATSAMRRPRRWSLSPLRAWSVRGKPRVRCGAWCATHTGGHTGGVDTSGAHTPASVATTISSSMACHTPTPNAILRATATAKGALPPRRLAPHHHHHHRRRSLACHYLCGH